MIINISNKLNTSGIYKINYDNGKIYIGQAMNILARAYEHNSKNKQVCDQALKKHDATIEILEEVLDITLLDEKEAYWTTYFNAKNKQIGYNILDGGNASGKRGIENCNAMFNEQSLNEVIDLLLNHHEISIKKIADLYNVDQNTIIKISKGITYHNNNLIYPLRNNNHESQQKNQIFDYFASETDLLNLKEDLKYRWDLSLENDLKNKYNIPLKILRDINQGRIFNTVGNFDYPIRTKNIRNIYNLTIDDIQDILNDLRNTKDSMTAIGEKYHLNRDTISKINKGKSYIIKNYDYPAR